MSTRIYRAAWLVVAVPVLVAAFSVGRPDALPAPRVQPFFDRGTAVQFASEFANQFPDRSPGTEGQRDATDWVERQLRSSTSTSASDVLGGDPRGRDRELVNLVAVAPPTGPANTQSNRAVSRHGPPRQRRAVTGCGRQRLGDQALLELGGTRNASLSHRSSGLHRRRRLRGFGAAHFADPPVRRPHRRPRRPRRDQVGRLAAARVPGDTSRVPSRPCSPRRTGPSSPNRGRAERPGALAQLVDLAFPFSFYEQAPSVSRACPRSRSRRRRSPAPARWQRSQPRRGETASSAGCGALGSLDQSAEVASRTQSTSTSGRAFLGWTLQLHAGRGADPLPGRHRRPLRPVPGAASPSSRRCETISADSASRSRSGSSSRCSSVGLLPSVAARPIGPDTAAAGTGRSRRSLPSSASPPSPG